MAPRRLSGIRIDLEVAGAVMKKKRRAMQWNRACQTSGINSPYVIALTATVGDMWTMPHVDDMDRVGSVGE